MQGAARTFSKNGFLHENPHRSHEKKGENKKTKTKNENQKLKTNIENQEMKIIKKPGNENHKLVLEVMKKEKRKKDTVAFSFGLRKHREQRSEEKNKTGMTPLNKLSFPCNDVPSTRRDDEKEVLSVDLVPDFAITHLAAKEKKVLLEVSKLCWANVLLLLDSLDGAHACAQLLASFGVVAHGKVTLNFSDQNFGSVVRDQQ